ncbi:DEAD/DEAH box helicase family protein [Bacteroides sp. 51]|uniref:DEAD/DEAH box helicase family protein n=1 Tax=Bacteroides sp. 51 TaxID=2302938 RepID=UPI0013D1C640|nr:DEAD/DEAH box helicase family protein [Bacteroides sp. 51]NDV84104.1 hypothetical protein [Bacteroides sp. 51]
MNTNILKLFKDRLGRIPYLRTILKKIPTNTILCKTLTGLGATYGEIKAKRHSIIIEPNVPVIKGKCKDFKHQDDNLFGVYEGVKVDRIMNYISSTFAEKKNIKILTTPESFSKIKQAFENLEINMFQHCFLLFDECHKLVKDADYREGIHLPIDDFFRFENKALVSATPIEFSDPRFKDFQYLKIEPQFDYKKDIRICHTNNTLQVLKSQIEEREKDGQTRFCIFINSTDTIFALIKRMDLLGDSAVFCADTSKRNLKKKGFINAYTEWSFDNMKKFNFFTSRFNAAFDIEIDEKPDVFMLTDLYLVEHTILDPNSDIIQVIGRFRNGVDYVAHITNTTTDYSHRSREDVYREIDIYEGCYKLLSREYRTATETGTSIAYRALLNTSPYNKFLDAEKKKSFFAIDNYVNEVMVRNLYLDKDVLFNAYYSESLLKHFMAYSYGYYFKTGDYERLQITNTSQTIVSKRKVIVDILENMLPYETESDFQFIEHIEAVDELIVEAVNVLGVSKVRSLCYSTGALRTAINEKKKKTPQTIELIKEYFKVGEKYTLAEIKAKIKEIYKKQGVEYETGVTAQTIKLYFLTKKAKKSSQDALYLISELP